MSRFTRRLVPGAALLLTVALTAACGQDDGAAGDDRPDAPTDAVDGEDTPAPDDDGVPDPRGPELEIDHGHPYTVRIADAYYDPNALEVPGPAGGDPAPADHTYLHLTLTVEGVDDARELPAPPHGTWEVRYPGCEEYAMSDTPDSCDSAAWPIGQASHYLTREQVAEGDTWGLTGGPGSSDTLEPGVTYYKSVWWTVAEDALPEDPEFCEAPNAQEDGAAPNCVPIGDVRASVDAS